MYRVLSPDRIDTEPQTYDTLRQAKKALTRFVHRYSAQGFYSQTCYNGYVRRISLHELPDYCEIVEAQQDARDVDGHGLEIA